ncbi:Uncharacterised protein [Vibrio cholerae]|nr:Uncharacterised protein [Vibrio cholerae]
MLGQFGRLLFHHIFVADLANRKVNQRDINRGKNGKQ